MTKDELLAVLRPHGQEHLLAFWDELDPSQRESLARQIENIDFELLGRLHAGRGQPGPQSRRRRHPTTDILLGAG
jgi:UDP-N-acetylglucosamine/UDP-N-acetylgalactosamine diphosphorylase